MDTEKQIIKIKSLTTSAFGTKIYLNDVEIKNCIDIQIFMSAREDDPNKNFTTAQTTLVGVEVDIEAEKINTEWEKFKVLARHEDTYKKIIGIEG